MSAHRTTGRAALRAIVPMLDLTPSRVLAAVASSVATLGAAFALAAVSAWLITTAWTQPPVLDLTVAVVTVRALGISRGVFRWVERMTTHDTALRGVVSLRTGIFTRLATSRTDRIARLTRGDLLARLGDDAQELAQFVIRSLVPGLSAVVMAVAVLALVAPMSWSAAAAMLIGLLIAGVAAPALAYRAARATESAVVTTRADLTSQVTKVLDDASVLRVEGALSPALADLASLQRASDGALDRAAAPAAAASAMVPLAMAVSILGSVLAAGSAWLDGGISAGVVGVLLLIPLSSYEAASELPAAASQLARSEAASARIVDALGPAAEQVLEPAGAAASANNRAAAAHSSSASGAPASAGSDGRILAVDAVPSLRAESLTVGWSPDRPRIRDLDLLLEPGARLAIVGPSGCGKSTLLRTLAGLLDPISGAVLLGDRDVARMPDPEIRARIVDYAEDAHVFETNVRENLRVARGDATDDEILAALDQAGLGTWVAGLPRSLDQMLGPHGTTISGGERRRLLLARALVRKAPISLLDEPTEHLDPALAVPLLHGLLSRGPDSLLGPERTVVVVTHQVDAIPEGTPVLRLDAPA